LFNGYTDRKIGYSAQPKVERRGEKENSFEPSSPTEKLVAFEENDVYCH
jgi:hypothetical protein